MKDFTMFLCVWVGKFYKNWYYRIPLNFGVSLGQAKSVSITEMLKAAVSLKGILFFKKNKEAAELYQLRSQRRKKQWN